jgi:hypothetical protein
MQLQAGLFRPVRLTEQAVSHSRHPLHRRGSRAMDFILFTKISLDHSPVGENFAGFAFRDFLTIVKYNESGREVNDGFI